jgi:hypothetical protein
VLTEDSTVLNRFNGLPERRKTIETVVHFVIPIRDYRAEATVLMRSLRVD